MVLPRSECDREYKKFIETIAGEVAIRVIPFGGLLDWQYDYVELSEGVTTKDYIYKDGGSSGTVVGTIRITYTNASKKKFLSAERL